MSKYAMVETKNAKVITEVARLVAAGGGNGKVGKNEIKVRKMTTSKGKEVYKAKVGPTFFGVLLSKVQGELAVKFVQVEQKAPYAPVLVKKAA